MVFPLRYSFCICKTRSIITLNFHSEDNNYVLKIMIVTLKDVCVYVCVCVCVCVYVCMCCSVVSASLQPHGL